MDELVKRTDVVDGALVKAITALLPGESIDRILDETRTILMKRVVADIQNRNFPTVFHILEHLKNLDFELEDATTVLTWCGESAIVESGLVCSFYKYISVPEPSSSPTCCCIHPKTLH